MAKNKFTSVFNIKFLPMDYGRLHYMLFRLFLVRPIGLDGKKYKKNFSKKAIIAANHTGFIDGPGIGCCFWYRRVFMLASEEVMSGGAKSFFLRLMGCIKIDRNISDIDGLRKALDVLRDDRVLAVFPQGHIEEDSNVSDIKSGAVLLASQSGAPIVPVYSGKSKGVFKKRVFVIGDPFFCSDYCKKKFLSVSDMKMLSEVLADKINQCRRVYETTVKGE